jgi:signal peptidase II
MNKNSFISLLIGLLGFALDRGHKYFQLEIRGWSGGEFVEVNGFLDYVMVWNKGISFGIFGSLSPVYLSILMAIALLALGIWWLKEKSFIAKLGLAIAIGGAFSNLIDRLIYGAVADFFHLHFGQYSIFVNNIADIVIFIGVLLLVIDMLFSKKPLQSSLK